MSTQDLNIRPPAVAGQFYPERASELRRQVESLLSQASCKPPEGEVKGLIAPHAGYPYSGRTAADAYCRVRGENYDTVVIMAPSHRENCNGVSIFPGDAYETPLGAVPVDREMAGTMACEDRRIRLSMSGHHVGPGGAFGSLRGEHALEVQLPFLQVVLPDLRIVPIVMDSRSWEACRHLADALVRGSEGKRVLLVASSDLYHGHDYDACLRSDARTLEEIEAFDPERFFSSLEAGSAQACGGGPVTTLMLAARQMGANRVQVVGRTNSNDVLGQRGGYVVGYGAVLLCADPAAAPQHRELTEGARAALGRIARNSVRNIACGETPEDPELYPPELGVKQGAFVTLRCRGALRGCIGDIYGHEPLGITVQTMAIAAASQDPRFPPLSESELEGLEIEISVLSPMQRISTPSEVEVGRHGLWIRRNAYQGVLLPQVAVEQGWDRNQFLSYTCRKAHLPPNAWQDADTEIRIFSAEIFPA